MLSGETRSGGAGIRRTRPRSETVEEASTLEAGALQQASQSTQGIVGAQPFKFPASFAP